jgi:hypothetical protein
MNNGPIDEQAINNNVLNSILAPINMIHATERSIVTRNKKIKIFMKSRVLYLAILF